MYGPYLNLDSKKKLAIWGNVSTAWEVHIQELLLIILDVVKILSSFCIFSFRDTYGNIYK
jgi:hypothetical protein